MHLHDQIPVIVLHVLEADIPKDAGIIDEYIYPAKSLDSRVDDSIAVLDGVVVGDCLAAGSLDLFNNDISSLRTVRTEQLLIRQSAVPSKRLPRP